VIAAVQEGTEGAELATSPDLAELRSEFKANLAELRVQFKADHAALRSELRETELRLEAKIEAVRSDIAAVKADNPEPCLRHDPRRLGGQHHRRRRSHVRGGKAGRALRVWC
jgi:hypothetical protein